MIELCNNSAVSGSTGTKNPWPKPDSWSVLWARWLWHATGLHHRLVIQFASSYCTQPLRNKAPQRSGHVKERAQIRLLLWVLQTDMPHKQLCKYYFGFVTNCIQTNARTLQWIGNFMVLNYIYVIVMIHFLPVNHYLSTDLKITFPT